MNVSINWWINDGTINLTIKDSKTRNYTYHVDAAMIPGWLKLIKTKPGKTFNEIKQHGKLIRIGKI